MQIDVQRVNNVDRLTVKPTGKINIETADEFKAIIKDNIQNIKELIIDVAGIDYISSMGLRVLLEIHNLMKDQKGAMYLKNLNKDVKNVIEISGFNSFLNILD